jgi:hypothetical protein
MEFFGILRCAQDDSKGKGKDKSRSRFPSGMTTKKQLVGEGDVDGVAFDDAVASGGCLRYDGAEGDGLKGGRG